jgi:hypothetical protein
MLGAYPWRVPKMDDGPTDGPPGRTLKTATVVLTEAEARELLLALRAWAEEVAEGDVDPGWHTHVLDDDGNELTVGIEASRSPA